MAKYTEADLQQAIIEVKNGSSIKQAAEKWGVPRRTLGNRMNGSEPRGKAHQHQQRLSQAQEEHLTQWILAQEALGYAPTHEQIRLFVTKILELGGDTKPLGKRWMDQFFQRNPAIRTKRGKRIECQRLNGASNENIRAFFKLLASPSIKRIPAKHRWNMDETGIMEGFGINGLVVGAAQQRAVYTKSPQTRCWTSIVECVSAEGEQLDPLIIFRGKHVQQQWFFEEDLPQLAGWHFTASDNGWTSNEIALQWLKEVFIPKTMPLDPAEPRLLVVDGHGSHESDEFMYECFRNNIQMLFLPAHASHVLQPLDLSIFSPLKTAYRRWTSKLFIQTDSSPAGKQGFLRCYLNARKDAITPQNVKSGWRATGLWPVNVAKPLMSRQVVEPKPSRTPTKKKTTQDSSTFDPLINEHLQKQINTPQRGAELKTLAQRLEYNLREDPTTRLLFRKISKGLDNKNISLAQQDTKIQSLEAQIQRLKPQKKSRVRQDPNERFVSIEEVIEKKKKLAEEQEKEAQRGEQRNKVFGATENTDTYVFEQMCHSWQLDC